MHSIKLIRQNPEFFKKKLSERNVDLNIDDLLNLDKKSRDLIQKKEKLEQEKKIISKKKIKIYLFVQKKSQMKFNLLANLLSCFKTKLMVF